MLPDKHTISYVVDRIGQYYQKSMEDNTMGKKKVFKDLFDRKISLGDTVLYVWANDDLYHARGDGDPGAIQYRIGKVIRFTPKSIRLEYLKKGEKVETSIFNTHNRIIIMSDNGEIEADDESKQSLKEKDDIILELQRSLLKTTQALNRTSSKVKNRDKKIIKLTKDNKDAENEFKKYHNDRFDLIDL